MSENHIRGISTTLALLDKTLCEFALWAKGHEVRSILYQVLNPLSEVQRRLISAELSEMKGILEEIRGVLNLEPTVRSADKMIISSCSILWASLVELEGRHLRRYGVVPAGLAEFLEPKVETLNNRMRKIADIVAERSSR
jgi:hypothetical protein